MERGNASKGVGHSDLLPKKFFVAGGIKMGRTTPTVEVLEQYCAAHPDSPVAVRRPKLFFRSGTWIAILGDNIEDGIVGFGSSAQAALRTFDLIYRRAGDGC